METIAASRVADASTAWVSARLGKRECIWQDMLDLADVGSDANPVRRVYRLGNEPDTPMRHTAKRRRIKTVVQELMFKAARTIRHAGRWVLGLGESDSGFAVF